MRYILVDLNKAWSESARQAAIEARRANKGEVVEKKTTEKPKSNWEERRARNDDRDRAERFTMNKRMLKENTFLISAKRKAIMRTRDPDERKGFEDDIASLRTERHAIVSALKRDNPAGSGSRRIGLRQETDDEYQRRKDDEDRFRDEPDRDEGGD